MKQDKFWLLTIIGICAITTFGSNKLSLEMVFSAYSWKNYSATNIFELIFFVGKAVLNYGYIIHLILPLFIKVKENSVLLKEISIANFMGVLLGCLNVVFGSLFIIAYLAANQKYPFLATFMFGLLDCIAGTAILIGRYFYDQNLDLEGKNKEKNTEFAKISR